MHYNELKRDFLQCDIKTNINFSSWIKFPFVRGRKVIRIRTVDYECIFSVFWGIKEELFKVFAFILKNNEDVHRKIWERKIGETW